MLVAKNTLDFNVKWRDLQFISLFRLIFLITVLFFKSCKSIFHLSNWFFSNNTLFSKFFVQWNIIIKINHCSPGLPWLNSAHLLQSLSSIFIVSKDASSIRYHRICITNPTRLCFRDDPYLCICADNHTRVECILPYTSKRKMYWEGEDLFLLASLTSSSNNNWNRLVFESSRSNIIWRSTTKLDKSIDRRGIFGSLDERTENHWLLVEEKVVVFWIVQSYSNRDDK